MIGTSDGLQHEDEFSYLLSLHGLEPQSSKSAGMGVEGPEKAPGASKSSTGTQLPSQFPQAPDPDSFHIDRTKDVPLAASALHKDGQFYGVAVDKDAPKTDFGIPGWDPAHGVFLHERAEFDHMNHLIMGGMTPADAYHEAHDKIATPIETAYVRATAVKAGKDPDSFLDIYKQYWRDAASYSAAKAAKEDINRHPDAHTTTFGLDESELGRKFSDGLMHLREFIHGENQPTKEQIEAGDVKPIWADIAKGVGLGMMAMGEQVGTGGLPRMYKPTKPPANIPSLEKAKALGYDQPTFHGTARGEFAGPDLRVGQTGQFYSTSSPELANKYAGYHEEGDYAYNSNHQVIPLVLKTKNYHEVDAGGATWTGKGMNKIHEGINYAYANKKDGVIVRNIHDEPSGSSKKLPPQDIYITLKGNSARSWFAKFDPAKMHLNDLLASGFAAIVPAGALSDKDE